MGVVREGGGCLVLFGLGGGIDSPGAWSLIICQFHSSLSSAILIHSFTFPSLLSLFFVVCLPVVLSPVVIVSAISSCRRVCSECMSALLLVMRIPPFGRGFALQAVSICLGGWVVGPLMIFPR